MNQTRRSRPYKLRRQRTPGRWRWERRGREGWQRGRVSGGYGSQFDSWRAGVGLPAAGFGFGPGETRGPGGFEDQDWQPTRPARGRGSWAGDWEDAPVVGRSIPDRSVRGRGPKSYQRPDDRILDDICERLTDDPMVDASDITVRVEQGEVTLSGTVATRDEKWRAEDCVEEVSGVREVFNQLRTNAR